MSTAHALMAYRRLDAAYEPYAVVRVDGSSCTANANTWNVSSVTNMNIMFHGCTAFNGTPARARASRQHRTHASHPPRSHAPRLASGRSVSRRTRSAHLWCVRRSFGGTCGAHSARRSFGGACGAHSVRFAAAALPFFEDYSYFTVLGATMGRDPLPKRQRRPSIVSKRPATLTSVPPRTGSSAGPTEETSGPE